MDLRLEERRSRARQAVSASRENISESTMTGRSADSEDLLSCRLCSYSACKQGERLIIDDIGLTAYGQNIGVIMAQNIISI